MPGGTYLVLTPRKSLAELDPNPAMAKAVQDAIGEFRIRIVPGRHWTPANEAALCGDLRNLVGEATIKLEIVPEILHQAEM